MTTAMGHAATAATIHFVTQSPSQPDFGQIWSILYAVDMFLFGLAVVILLVFLALILKSRQDPLRRAPFRPNQVREDALALAVTAYLLAVVILGGLMALIHLDPEGLMSTIVLSTGAQLAGAMACLAVAARRFDGGVGRFLFGPAGAYRRSWVPTVLLLAVVGIGFCPAIGELTMRLVRIFTPEFSFPQHPTIRALRDQAQPVAVIAALWFGATVMAPIAEEVFFRGLLQTAMMHVTRSRWKAIALASLIFGLVHYRQPHTMGALIVLAVILGFAYERTGSLVPPVLIHAAFNAKTLVWEALGAYST